MNWRMKGWTIGEGIVGGQGGAGCTPDHCENVPFDNCNDISNFFYFKYCYYFIYQFQFLSLITVFRFCF